MIRRPPRSTRTNTLFPTRRSSDLQFRAGKGSAKTIAAIEMLRDLNRSGKRDLPADAPMPFRKEWRKIVVGDDGKINRRLWEIATIAHLRNKLRSGDVWRSEEHTSELQSLMRISYAVFCLKKKNITKQNTTY